MGSCILLNTIGVEWVYKALEEYSYITIMSLLFKTVAVIMTFLLIKSKDDVDIYGFIFLFSNFIAYILNFFHVKKYVDFVRGSKLDIKKHLKPVFTLFAASAIITILLFLRTALAKHKSCFFPKEIFSPFSLIL